MEDRKYEELRMRLLLQPHQHLLLDPQKGQSQRLECRNSILLEKVGGWGDQSFELKESLLGSDDLLVCESCQGFFQRHKIFRKIQRSEEKSLPLHEALCSSMR